MKGNERKGNEIMVMDGGFTVMVMVMSDRWWQ